jgi:hypothetical protein
MLVCVPLTFGFETALACPLMVNAMAAAKDYAADGGIVL